MRRSITTLAVMLAIASLSGCATLPWSAKDRKKEMISKVRQVALACHLFASQHNDMLPPDTEFLAPYFRRDFDLRQFEIVATGKLSEISNPKRTVMVRSKKLSSDGKRAIAYVDGYCEIGFD